MKVKVKTDGDNYVLMECGRAEVEFEKDGDSPACPRSWTWHAYFDGEHIEGCIDEASLAASVWDATNSITQVIGELKAIRDYLIAYGAFAKEPEVTE